MKRARKLKRKLEMRIRDFENTVAGKGDIVRKHPTGFHKPGSNTK